MTNRLEEQIQKLLARMDEHNGQEGETGIPGNEATDGIQDVYVLIVRESEEDHTQIVDSTPVPPHTISFFPAYAICLFYLLLICSTLLFQLYCIVNPPLATITIIPKSQTVTLNGTLQLGRVLPPLTISQSQTTPATGKGHQDAKAATGYITLYNGQFQNVTIAAGTILTGASGIQIITDQDAAIPAANPPSFGQVTIAAHAINAGVNGNIPSYDINQACCATSVLAKNTQPFYGGQDERTYTTVTQKDIHSVSTVLTTSLTQSMQGALQGQLKPDEQLFILPCNPTVTSDDPIGAEASSVTVTVSQTCSAVAYSSQELQTKVTAFLATQALHKTGNGYSLFGDIHVSVKQASLSHTNTPLVFLSFSASGTWIYGISRTAQEQIKHLIASKTKDQAMQLLASIPGVESAAIRFQGFGDNTRLPKNTGYMHLTIFVV